MVMLMLKRQWTVDDLEDLPNDSYRYEIIDGELYVTPAPSWTHQMAIGELFKLLDAYADGRAVGYVYFAPADVEFSPRRVVEPDLFVVPRLGTARPQRFSDVGRLLLAVEVLSPGTARADRVAKRTLFREEGVAEYWIVDLDSRLIERSTPGEARPEILIDRFEWAPDGATDPLAIDLREYFAKVLGA